MAPRVAVIVQPRGKGHVNANRGIDAKERKQRVLSRLRQILIGEQELIDIFVERYLKKVARPPKY